MNTNIDNNTNSADMNIHNNHSNTDDTNDKQITGRQAHRHRARHLLRGRLRGRHGGRDGRLHIIGLINTHIYIYIYLSTHIV